MRATRFFRIVWRTNGVLILLGCLVWLLIMGLLAFQSMGGFMRRPEPPAIQMAGPPGEDLEPPELGHMESVVGTPYLRAELNFEGGGAADSFGSKGPTTSTRNCLFLHSGNLQSHWLFPDNRRLILESTVLTEAFRETGSQEEKSRAIAIFYQTVDSDTDGDKQITAEDRSALAYSRPDGHEFTVVMQGVDRILSMEEIDPARHLVVYQAGRKLWAVTVSLSSFSVEKKVELPSH